jgi:hypothetical protein
MGFANGQQRKKNKNRQGRGDTCNQSSKKFLFKYKKGDFSYRF